MELKLPGRTLFISVLCLLMQSATASDTAPETRPDNPVPMKRRFVHVHREHISIKERAANAGILYVLQWASYIIHQNEHVREHGSFSNWKTNILKPHFDRDSFGYNLFGHSVAGSLYYSFYRSRGYSESEAFTWVAISSAAFEFTVETATEKPSFQDLYQTPVMGTLLGMGLERASRYFHSFEAWPARLLGYILNPGTALPFASYEIRTTPIVQKEGYGAAVSLRF